MLNALLRERDLGNIAGLTDQTVNGFLDEWFEIAKQPAVRPKTLLEYQCQLKRYIRSVVGHRKLTDLEPMGLQKLYGGMLGRGLSARTVELTHRIFNDALDQALRWRKITFNPGCAVELPKQQRQETWARAGGIPCSRSFSGRACGPARRSPYSGATSTSPGAS